MRTDRQDMTRQAAHAAPPDRSIVGLLEAPLAEQLQQTALLEEIAVRGNR